MASTRTTDLLIIAENFQGCDIDRHKAWGNARSSQAQDHLDAGKTDMYDMVSRLAKLEYISSELLIKAHQCNKDDVDPDHPNNKTVEAHNAWADYRYSRMDVHLHTFRVKSRESSNVLSKERCLQGDAELKSAECLKKALENPTTKLWADYHRSRAEVFALFNNQGSRDKHLDNARAFDAKHVAEQAPAGPPRTDNPVQAQCQQQMETPVLSELELLRLQVEALTKENKQLKEVVSDQRNDKLVSEDTIQKLEMELEHHHYMISNKKLKKKLRKMIEDQFFKDKDYKDLQSRYDKLCSKLRNIEEKKQYDYIQGLSQNDWQVLSAEYHDENVARKEKLDFENKNYVIRGIPNIMY